MNRIEYDPYFVISEIPNSTDGVGADISLTLLYDEIKNARTEEDARLSLGIWERELKKADWPLVESLAVDILSNKSKDLQIMAWFIEALASMDKLDGIQSSLFILKLFLESFWYTCFPKKEDNSSDIDRKINILNWIEDKIANKIFTFHFVANISLYEYEYAVELKTLMKRSPETEASILRDAEKDNRKMLNDIYSELKSVNKESVKALRDGITKTNACVTSLKETLGKILDNSQVVSFSQIVDYISRISKIVDQTYKEELNMPEKEKIPNAVSSETSDDIYSQISRLSTELKKLERHSPAPFVLDLVVSWQNKTLFEVMSDLKTGTTEAHKLLKTLINNGQ
ncbi:MAG: type VI secretion system ImpA family N-terminal domain-containing protein [Holosporales bacterium]|jgi:type VI secretion system protein ImpA|nr:type VI secretion system ImpA family N-terminal domain-containing protein [Holosporales bacterium]